MDRVLYSIYLYIRYMCVQYKHNLEYGRVNKRAQSRKIKAPVVFSSQPVTQEKRAKKKNRTKRKSPFFFCFGGCSSSLCVAITHERWGTSVRNVLVSSWSLHTQSGWFNWLDERHRQQQQQYAVILILSNLRHSWVKAFRIVHFLSKRFLAPTADDGTRHLAPFPTPSL